MSEVREYTVYKFQECPNELKAKIIENYRDINVNYDWWLFTLDLIHDDLMPFGIDFDVNNIAFDIDRGRSFYLRLGKPKIVNKKKFAKFLGLTRSERYYYYNDYIDFRLENPSYNWRECFTELKIYDDREHNTTDLTAYKDKVYNLLQEKLYLLRAEYEYLLSEESIIDTLIANGYNFDDQGYID